MYESGKREGEKRNLDPARDKSLSQRGGENKRTMKCISLRKKGRKTNQKVFCKANEVQFVHKKQMDDATYGGERESDPARGQMARKARL